MPFVPLDVCSETIMMKSLKTHSVPFLLDLADEMVPTSEDLSLSNIVIIHSTSTIVDTTSTTPVTDVAAVKPLVKTDSSTAMNTTSTTASLITTLNDDY